MVIGMKIVHFKKNHTFYFIYLTLFTVYVCFINRIQTLEKDLYYYKKKTREHRQKTKELHSSGAISSQGESF